MFNVLPDNFKDTLKSQYKKRRIIVWMVAFLWIEAAFLVCLLPSYVYLVSEENNLVAESASSAGKKIQDNNNKTEQVLQNVNKELSVLSTDLSSVDANAVISRAFTLKGSAITFRDINYKSANATTSILTITGTAKTRDALLSLSKRFETDPIFQKVDLPVSNFAKDKNIDFSMKVEAKI